MVTCLNQMFCGLLQSEGRSLVYGTVQVSNFVLNMAVYDPLFLIAFKMGIMGAGVATVCSEATPMVVVAVLFFCGKFDTRTTPGHFTKCFSRDAWEAIKTGFTQFVVHLSYGLPALLTRKYVTYDAEAMDCYTDCLAAFNSILRVWPFAQSYAVAIATAFLPSASFAVGAKRPARVLRLFAWGSLLAFLWCAFGEMLLLALAKYIALIFGNSPGLINATVPMITNTYALQALAGQPQLTIGLLQSMGFIWTAIAVSVITQSVAAPVFGTLLFFTDSDHDLFRLMWMYSIGDAFALVVCLGFTVVPLRTLWSEAKTALEGEIELQGFHERDEVPADEGNKAEPL
jgi:Na+-driven multidrug efflux pump